ncbi:MAG: hypothetical protein Q9197_004379 [Variospora fuerteventurae]
MGSNSFEEALSDLEMLADIRFNLRPSEFFQFRDTYNRKIILVLNTIYGRFSDMISKQALQYLQRLTAVRAKLSDYMSTHGTEQMNRLVKESLHATEAAFDQADKISGDLNDQSWEVQLAPRISEDGDLPGKDPCGADAFAYDAGKKKFSYRRNGERMYWSTEDMVMPTVASYTFGDDHHCIRLMRFGIKSIIPCRTTILKLPTVYEARELIGHLADLGVSVIQRPLSDDDLDMRMTTTLHDLAVRLPQPTTLATPRPLSELPDDISQRRGSCIAQFTPPKATK